MLWAGTGNCTAYELLGHSGVAATMLYTHVLKVVVGGRPSRWRP
nr:MULTISPECIES: hypothetical protein [Hydrogenophaga]